MLIFGVKIVARDIMDIQQETFDISSQTSLFLQTEAPAYETHSVGLVDSTTTSSSSFLI